MNDEINYKHNPLHGLSLKSLLTELVDHYGYEILFAYLNINCFKTNASIESSVKFLKKTNWAREKVEAFYLYQFKSLPRASAEQFELPPRDRIIPEDQIAGEPAELSLEDAARLREKRERKATEFGRGGRPGSGKGKNSGGNAERRTQAGKPPERNTSTQPSANNPWAKWKGKT
ncbi:Uncharacterized conserved protein, DUF2132 family [Alteromonadaceae bacterium Bs31]|nr:Uncharacterized conserved protein, DUF2132 family [Alteromonadaceae bacterium Bs31]